MSFGGFGVGVGDIVIVSQLAYQLYVACSARSKAPAEVQLLAQELWNLNSVLDQLVPLVALPGSPFQRPDVAALAHSLLEGSRASFENAWRLFDKYDGVRRRKNTTAGMPWTKRLLGWTRTVQWSYEKDKLAGLRAEFGSYCQGLTLLLNIVNGNSIHNIDSRLREIHSVLSAKQIPVDHYYIKADINIGTSASGSDPACRTSQALSSAEDSAAYALAPQNSAMIQSLWAQMIVDAVDLSLFRKSLSQPFPMTQTLSQPSDELKDDPVHSQQLYCVALETLSELRRMWAALSPQTPIRPPRILEALLVECVAMSRALQKKDKARKVPELEYPLFAQLALRQLKESRVDINARKTSIVPFPEAWVDFHGTVMRFWCQVLREITMAQHELYPSDMLNQSAHFEWMVSSISNSRTALRDSMISAPPSSATVEAILSLGFDNQRYGKSRQATLKTLSDLSSVMPDVENEAILQRNRQWPDTCRWIFHHQSYRAWMLGIQPRILWLHARPGAGKSVLAAFLANQLRAAGEVVAYFPFRYNNAALRGGGSCLRSIAWQMAVSSAKMRESLMNSLNEMPGGIEALQQQQQTSAWAAAAGAGGGGGGSRAASVGYLWQWLFSNAVLAVQASGDRDAVYWLLDAIDEGDPSDIAQLFTLLADVQGATMPIKLIIFSRYTTDIARRLNELPIQVVEARPDDNRTDIRTYAETRLRQIWGDLAEEELAKTRDEVVDKANGTFLWAARALDAMGEEYVVEDRLAVLRCALGSGAAADASLSDLYGRIFDYMARHLSPSQCAIARKMLAWTAFAARPLTTDELAVVLKVSFGRIVDVSLTVRNLCGQLLAIDDRRRVQTNHMTVQEYLRSGAPPPQFRTADDECHGEMAALCAALLLDERHGVVKDASSANAVDIRGLLPEEKAVIKDYAVGYCFTHLCSTSYSAARLALLDEIFDRGGVITWIRCLTEQGQVRDMQAAVEMLCKWLPTDDKRMQKMLKIRALGRRLGTLDYSYSGDMVDGLRQGRGVCRYSNGDVYEGEWWHDVRQGQGRCRFGSGDVYEGAWLVDEFHGQGKLHCPDGSSYEGGWVSGRRTGHGVMKWTWTWRRQYVGEFLNDRFHGMGTMTYTFGTEYRGMWSEGREHGHGLIVYWNGGEYQGQFEDGAEAGEIKMVGEKTANRLEWTSGTTAVIHYRTGARFEGKVDADGVPNGEGTLIGNSGVVWKGRFRNGCTEGFGTAVRPDGGSIAGTWSNFTANGDDYTEVNGTPGGGTFVGSLRDCAREGKGELKSAYGYTYTGDFHRNELHGRGSIRYDDGSSFRGGFRDGRAEGDGEMRYSDNWTYRGPWQKDCKNGPDGCLSLPGWGRFEGTWVNDQLRGPARLIMEEGVCTVDGLPCEASSS